ncbi:MAG TPA: tRNA uridine-5-carboxymethylaminomethyl(34) synthesis GTPase MnmE [Burkholderiales bacterium]|nr:tRNA uridine-5-carboxymethylaminomethyl(34) synthesis GTPase MnmE [Burkholderiales bacterium]
MPPADTIAAIATAPGRAGIGVVRVSGPAARTIASALTGALLAPRRATLARFSDGHGELIDQGIALFFPAPHSYTGEDVLELHGHGGPAILRLLLHRCFELGARPAQPGEFTLRAFFNGKLDLAQAEAVADLIDASSAAAARGAMRSLAGAFSKQVRQLRDGLLELRAFVEAVLDFPEEDVDLLERDAALSRLEALRARLAEIIKTAKQGNLLREGVRTVLLGRPNVGKSSLMNLLAQEEVSIVTEVPGTTRDALRRDLTIEGVPIHLVDTAGLRESADLVEQLGVQRSWDEIRRADLLLHVYDATHAIEPEDEAIERALPRSARKIRVFNKIDLLGEVPRVSSGDAETHIWLSAKTGAGVELLRRALLEAVGWQNLEEAPFMARERHLAALAKAESALVRASAELHQLELLAEELRLAQLALGEITGEVTSDDLLGEIFSRFCIGK